jgi:hypothetical protein
MEVIRIAAVPALLVELPMALATASTPDPYVVEDCRKADLDIAMGEDTRSLNL